MSQSDIYTVFCIVMGEDVAFSVEVAKTEIVSELKTLIKEENPDTFAGIEANFLDLYHVDIPDAHKEVLMASVKACLLDSPLLPTTELSEIFPGIPKKHTVHFLVKPSRKRPASTQLTNEAKRRMTVDRLPRLPPSAATEQNVLEHSGPCPRRHQMFLTPLAQRDITNRLVAKWSRPSPALNLRDLHVYLRQPLAEDEKIPISQLRFDWLSRKSDFPEHEFGAEQLATLFRVSEEVAPRAAGIFEFAIELVPPASGIEDVFHGTWDVNIKNILSLILAKVEPIRNSNGNTSTGLQRPDSGFLVKGSCVVRGEEKGSDSGSDPQLELVDKLKWTYSPLPYILGYYAITTKVDFVAITAPPSTETVPLFNHDLKFKHERVANLVNLIRFSQVVAELGEKLHNRDRPEFVDFERDGGLVRMSIAGVVRKEFRHPDAVARVEQLIEIYKLLKLKEVPNVDKLERFNIQGNYPQVQLSPVGHDTSPASGSESLNAVVYVLEALKPNIIKSSDGPGWLLIDWSDASMAPTRAVTHLTESEHSPRVRVDNHGAEVDIWGVGRYLENLASRVTCGIAKPDAVQQMARRWMAALTTSAAAALDEINENKDLFTRIS